MSVCCVTIILLFLVRSVSVFSHHQVSLINFVASLCGAGGIQAFKTMRTLRALRPLRAMSRMQGMRVGHIPRHLYRHFRKEYIVFLIICFKLKSVVLKATYLFTFECSTIFIYTFLILDFIYIF